MERQPAKSAPAATPPEPAPTRTDSVVISDDARDRLAVLADEARQRLQESGNTEGTTRIDRGPELRQDKIRLARARIRSGYYNQPEVKEAIAERLADELTTQPPENPETPTQP